MIPNFENLTVLQVEQLFDGPALVALLIAGADGHVEKVEIDRALEVVHVKTFSEYSDLKEFYKELEPDFSRRFNHLLSILPIAKKERNEAIVARLIKLNDVIFLLPYNFSLHYYRSMKNYAIHIANAAGGIGGLFKISDDENQFLHLEMLKEPTHHTE